MKKDVQERIEQAEVRLSILESTKLMEDFPGGHFRVEFLEGAFRPAVRNTRYEDAPVRIYLRPTEDYKCVIKADGREFTGYGRTPRIAFDKAVAELESSGAELNAAAKRVYWKDPQ